MSNYLFIETEMSLESAVLYRQYIYNIQKPRVITVIGELHSSEFKCSNQSMSFAEYISQQISMNPDIQIFLEYNKNKDPYKVHSHGIVSVIKTLDKLGKRSLVIPFDIRPFYLTEKGQVILYSASFLDYTREQYKDMFIMPFFDKEKSDYFRYSKHKYPSDIYNYMMSNYLQEVENELKWVLKNLHIAPITTLHDRLRVVWMKVADFFLIRDILDMSNKSTEMIVLVGIHHADNIKRVFDKFPHAIHNEVNNEKRTDDCVKIYKYIKIDNAISELQ